MPNRIPFSSKSSMHHHPLAPFALLAAAVARGVLFVSGPDAALAFGLLALLGGALLRPWRALPLLTLGLLLGTVARIVNDSRWLLTELRFDNTTILFLGKGVFGLLVAYGVLTLLLALPVAAGRWLVTPRPPRTLSNNWRR